MRSVAQAGAGLILLGKPSAKLLSDLQSVVVADLLLSFLFSIDRHPIDPILDRFLNFLHDFLAVPVANIGNVATLIVADVVRHGHEDRIIIDSVSGRFNSDLLVRFSLKNQDACLHTHVRLKGVRV